MELSVTHPDQSEWELEAAEADWFEEQLKSVSEAPVFAYLACHGDAIQERVDRCLNEARDLLESKFFGASLVRAAGGIEIAPRFFLARPLLEGAFLSDEWARALSDRILGSRSADDRELLPAILRNWSIEISQIRLKDGSQLWQSILSIVWKARNEYVHAGADIAANEAELAITCLEELLASVVDPLSRRLGFTRRETGCWSLVASTVHPELNSPQNFERASPFKSRAA